MTIDYEARILSLGCNRTIRGPISVQKVPVSFNNINIVFIFVNDGNSKFLYEDSLKYNELLKAIAGNPSEVGKILRKYERQFGIEHDLWKQLVTVTIRKFGIDCFSYTQKCDVDVRSDYWSCVFKSEITEPINVDDIDEVCKLLVSLLPENIDNTIKLHKQEEGKKFVEDFISLCGADLNERDLLLSKLENETENTIEDWDDSIQKLESAKYKLSSFSAENTIDSSVNVKLSTILDECIVFAKRKRDSLIESNLISQYGTIEHIKKNLRDSINRLGFKELLELYKEYNDIGKFIASKARCNGMIDNSVYEEYISAFLYGSLLISDKLNKLNRNKAKTKYIPQDLLDEAVVFYYEAETVAESYSVRANEKYSQDKESGDKGEQKVEYALKWLDSSFVKIEKKSSDKIGEQCIYLCNPSFIDEKQEYDHLIVSNVGVFNIETKNYAGKLVIDQYGNWIRKKNDEDEGIKNPLQQIRQHEKILKSFLPKECNVISIICIANDKAIIEGAENCPIPIIKSDMLVEYIENYNSDKSHMTDLQKEQCIKTIYDYMV